MTGFYQALNKPKNSNTKRTYEIWRKQVGQQRPYIDQIKWQMSDEINKQKKSKESWDLRY